MYQPIYFVTVPPPQATGTTNVERWVETRKHQKTNNCNVDESWEIAEFLFVLEIFSC